MALVNPIGAAVRQVNSATLGALKEAKQSRAENFTLTQQVLEMRPGNVTPLKVADYIRMAAEKKVPPVVFHVLSDKESHPDGGFTRLGRLGIAVEPQVFSKLTANRYDKSHPHLSYPKYVKYRRGAPPPAGFAKHPLDMSQAERWLLFTGMAHLNFNAALQALSIGRFQTMVMHWKRMGFPSPLAMYQYANQGEFEQLELCFKWFVMEDLVPEMRALNWAKIARYNGTGNIEAYEADCRKLCERRQPLYA